MGNTCACTRRVREASSSDMRGPSTAEHVTASATDDASSSSSPPLCAPRIRSIVDSMAESGGINPSVEQRIEESKTHWSVLAESEFDSTEDEVAADNREVFQALESHSTWGEFFWALDDFGSLEVGEKFAEGGQAELFHAKVTYIKPEENILDQEQGLEYVLKVFKKGTLLRNLQSQWPHGMLQFGVEETQNWQSPSPKTFPRFYCEVFKGTLLEDGRFAFLLRREMMDLRSLIDQSMKMRIGTSRGPFRKEDGECIMFDVALGMSWLHSRNIVHTDLKASNVLIHVDKDGYFQCFVADYKCSIGVVGTNFFRVPEFLAACKDKSVTKRQDLFTDMSNVYSYGMTCYEILTSKLPFDGHPVNDYDLVINGGRLEVPNNVDDWVRELLRRCW